MISSGVFLIFLKFLFFELLGGRGGGGEEIAQNEK